MTPAKKARRATASAPKTTASEVAPGVFVGGWGDAAAFEGTRFCVLDETPDAPFPAEVHVPIYDAASERPLRANLDRLAGLVEAARAKNEPVLLFCGHGVRRGPLAAAWYLHRHEGIPLDAAYERIRAVRPHIEVAREWISDTTALEGASSPSGRAQRGARDVP